MNKLIFRMEECCFFFPPLIEGDSCIANRALLNYFPLGQSRYKFRNTLWLWLRCMAELHTSNAIITSPPRVSTLWEILMFQNGVLFWNRKNQTPTLYRIRTSGNIHSENMFSGGIQLLPNFFTTLHYFAIGEFAGHNEKLI